MAARWKTERLSVHNRRMAERQLRPLAFQPFNNADARKGAVAVMRTADLRALIADPKTGDQWKELAAAELKNRSR